jgi:hypothetical protein
MDERGAGQCHQHHDSGGQRDLLPDGGDQRFPLWRLTEGERPQRAWRMQRCGEHSVHDERTGLRDVASGRRTSHAATAGAAVRPGARRR